MRLLIIWVSLLVIVFSESPAQPCGTEQRFLEIPGETDNSLNRTGPFEIPVNLVIYNEGESSALLTSSDASQIVESLNDFFLSKGYHFVLKRLKFLEVPELYHIDYDTEASLLDQYEDPGLFHIHIGYSVKVSGQFVSGLGLFPPGSPRVVVNYASAFNESTLLHEVGHSLGGLLHTHGLTSSLTDELVNGSNCSVAGDRICDTPADPNLANYDIYGCAYQGTTRDAMGRLFNPMESNIMSYAPAECRYELTIGQWNRFEEVFVNFRQADFTGIGCSTGYDVLIQRTSCVPGDLGTFTQTWKTSEGCDSTVTILTLAAESTSCPEVCQRLEVPEGFGMISSYMDPSPKSMAAIFQGLESDVLIIKDEQGRAFIPSWGLNQIGNWKATEGYKILTNNSISLDVCGSKVSPENSPIALRENWNLIPYLRDNPLDVSAALASLNPSNIVIVKDELGNVYVPSLNINTIGLMQPGKGYQVKVLGPATLLYPANGFQSERNRTTHLTEPVHFRTGISGRANATLLIPSQVVKGLETGDEVGVFDLQGKLFGSAVYEGDNMAITVWGEQEEFPDVAGMEEGQMYSLRAWKSGSNLERELHISMADGLPYFTEDGVSVLSELRVIENKETNLISQDVTVYPNPAGDQVYLQLPESTEGSLTFGLYTITGQSIMEIRNITRPWFEVDLSGLPAGTYLYHIRTREQNHFGKIIRQR